MSKGSGPLVKKNFVTRGTYKHGIFVSSEIDIFLRAVLKLYNVNRVTNSFLFICYN